MTSPLENLTGPGKPLKAEPPDAKEYEYAGLKRSGLARLAKCHDMRNRSDYEGLLDVDERIVVDLIAACRAVAAKLDALPPIGGT